MKIQNICAGQKYLDRQGQEKTKWTTIGKLFTKEDGKQSVKIEAVPVNWDGFAVVFDQQQNDARPGGGQRQNGGYSSPPQTQGGYPPPAGGGFYGGYPAPGADAAYTHPAPAPVPVPEEFDDLPF